jgi:hypothetical protein
MFIRKGKKQLTYLDNDNKNSNTDSSSREPSNNQLTRIHQASVSKRFYYSFFLKLINKF